MRTTDIKNGGSLVAYAGRILFALAAFSSHAMTLGELRGNAWIGQALDLRVPVQTDQGDALSEGCIHADVYYGDMRQKSPRLSTQASQLRLQVAAPVNEPVVTVQIRSFCGASQIRNYVLLADLPPDFSASVATKALAPVARPDAPNAESAPAAVVLPQGTVTSLTRASSPKPRKAARSAVKPGTNVKKPKAKASTAQRTQKQKKTHVQPVRSVLKLDPMEILSDRMDTLELNMPFAPAEDALLQSRQIAALQADLKSMRELAAKNDSALLELRGQLQSAQAQQQPTTLFYGLIAMLLLGVAGLLWLLQRQKKLTLAAQSWWQRPSDDDLTAFLNADVTRQASRPDIPQPDDAPPDKPQDKPRSQASPVTLQAPGLEPLEKIRNEPPPVVAPAPLKINPEPVQDIRQQAEFFISLGQDHRAIDILNQHIATAELPNPLICMDLLGLYLHANQTAEFDQLRDVCQQHFNVKLPAMATFQHEGRDLTLYPDVLTTLTRLWPGEQAQAFMDTCLFVNSGTKAMTAFDLAAFRDLLTLHAVAEELVKKSGSHPPASNLPELDFVLPQDPAPDKSE